MYALPASLTKDIQGEGKGLGGDCATWMGREVTGHPEEKFLPIPHGIIFHALLASSRATTLTQGAPSTTPEELTEPVKLES